MKLALLIVSLASLICYGQKIENHTFTIEKDIGAGGQLLGVVQYHPQTRSKFDLDCLIISTTALKKGDILIAGKQEGGYRNFFSGLSSFDSFTASVIARFFTESEMNIPLYNKNGQKVGRITCKNNAGHTTRIPLSGLKRLLNQPNSHVRIASPTEAGIQTKKDTTLNSVRNENTKNTQENTESSKRDGAQ